MDAIRDLGEASGASINELDLSVTIQADDDYLVVSATSEGAGSHNSMTFDPGGGDEATFTLSKTKVSSGDERVSIWSLQDASFPSSGTFTIRLSTSGFGVIGMGAIALQGAAQQTAEATAEGAASTSSVSTSITTLTDGAVVVDALSDTAQGNAVVDGSQTQFLDDPRTSYGGDGSYKEVETAGATSMDWTGLSGNPWAHALAAFAPAGGGGATGSVVDYVSPTLDGPAVTLGDGSSVMRYIRIPSGEYATPIWVRPDSDNSRTQKYDSLPAQIHLVAGQIEVLSSAPA